MKSQVVLLVVVGLMVCGTAFAGSNVPCCDPQPVQVAQAVQCAPVVQYAMQTQTVIQQVPRVVMEEVEVEVQTMVQVPGCVGCVQQTMAVEEPERMGLFKRIRLGRSTRKAARYNANVEKLTQPEPVQCVGVQCASPTYAVASPTLAVETQSEVSGDGIQ